MVASQQQSGSALSLSLVKDRIARVCEQQFAVITYGSQSGMSVLFIQRCASNESTKAIALGGAVVVRRYSDGRQSTGASLDGHADLQENRTFLD